MMTILKRELNHFYSLPIKLRQLLISFVLYATAYPIISVFINAFIWKNNANLPSLVFFRTGQFFVVPIIFFVNGLLLKFFKINYLYFFGSLIISLSVVLTVFFKGGSLFGFFIIGGLLGVGTGFYWANRNYLTIKETDDKNRSYFFGLLFSYATLIGLIVTFSVGWLIIFGLSYQILAIIAFAIIGMSGFYILKNNYRLVSIDNLFIKKVSPSWQKKRWIHLGIGIIEGMSFFVPSLLILSMIGNEGILGTLTAVSSVFSAILIYYYGRKSEMKFHKRYFILSVLINFGLSVSLALFFHKYFIIFFVLLNGLVINFIWLTLSPLVMRNIDLDSQIKKESRFNYVLDSEIFLNIGRIICCLLCVGLAFYKGDTFSLRYSPVFLSVIQFLLFVFLEKRK